MHCYVGADVNYAGGDLNETPLQWAIRSQYLPIIDLMVQKNGNMQHKSRCGYDSLHLACHGVNINIVALLLLAGADPSSLNDDGETILFWFIKNRCDCIDIIRLLLKFNIDLFIIDNKGDNVLHNMFMVSASSLQTNKRTIDWHLCYTILEWACRHKNRHDDFVDPATVPKQEHQGMTVIRNSGLFNAYHLMFGQKNGENKSVYTVAVEKKHQIIFRFLFDFFSYKLLNRYTVTFFSFGLVTMLFFCVHWFGWLAGMLAYFVLFLLHDFVAQSAVQPEMSRKSNGEAWGIIISLATGYLIYVQPYVSVAWGVVVLTMLGGICYSLYSTMISKPKRAKPDGDRLALHKCMVSSQVHIDLLADTKLVEPSHALSQAQSHGVPWNGVPIVSEPTTPNRVGGNGNDGFTAVEEGEEEDTHEKSRLLLRYNTQSPREPSAPPSLYATTPQVVSGSGGGASTGSGVQVNAAPTVWYDAKDHYDEHFRLCSSCLLNKSTLHSGTHCMYCDACTPDLDHHCHFVDNCVGIGNRRIFVIFTLFASTGCLLLACLYHHVVMHHYCSNVRDAVLVANPSAMKIFSQIYFFFAHEFALNSCAFSHKPTVFLLMWVSIMMVIWIGLLFLTQCLMVMLETTSYESAKGVQKVTTRVKSAISMTNEVAASRLVTSASIAASHQPLLEQASNYFCLFCCSPFGMNHPYNTTPRKIQMAIRNLSVFFMTGKYVVTQPPPILLNEFDPDVNVGSGISSELEGGSSSSNSYLSNREKVEEVSYRQQEESNVHNASLVNADGGNIGANSNTPISINRGMEVASSSSSGREGSKFTMRELSAMDRKSAKKL